MKVEDVKIGMEVYIHGDRGSIVTVKGLPDAHGMIVVEWYSTYSRKNITETCHLDELGTIDPEEDRKVASQVQEKLDQAKDSFESAFEALREACRIADDSGIGILGLRNFELISTQELEGVIGENGWSSSSLWC